MSKEIKVSTPFVSAFNGADTSETYRIIAVDVSADTATLEVSKVFNGEKWFAYRPMSYTTLQKQFFNNQYKYIQ